jgi:hypothetical protein
MIDTHQSSSCMIFTILGSSSTVVTEGSSMVWKNMSGVMLFF